MGRITLEAILLVGGQGTRLRPLTITTPKPLLPTAGVPFLGHQLARAREAGITRIVFATSYRASMFADCFGSGEADGLDLVYVTEDEPLGTGGAIRNASHALTCADNDPVVVLNGDILSGHALDEQIAFHQARQAAVTLHLTEVEDPSRFGCVPVDDDGRVLAFLEKTPDPVTNLINAGCYVFRRSVIDTIPAGQVVSVERETFPSLIASGSPVMGYTEASYWIDVGTPAAFVRGSCDLVLGKVGGARLAAQPDGSAGAEALILDGAAVEPGAKVRGGTTIGAGCSVAAGAVVDGSVLFDGAIVEAGASVRASVLGRGARVCTGAVLMDAVVGDGATIGPGNELLGGARIWPGVELPPTSIRFSSDA